MINYLEVQNPDGTWPHDNIPEVITTTNVPDREYVDVDIELWRMDADLFMGLNKSTS